MSVKMEVLLTFPTMGIAVSKGALATKLPDAEKGAGFVSARKGAVPVWVGPIGNEPLVFVIVRPASYLRRSPEKSGSNWPR